METPPGRRSGNLARYRQSFRRSSGPGVLLILGLLAGFLLPGKGTSAQQPEVIHLPQQPVPAPRSPSPSLRRAPMNVQEVLGELWYRRKASLEKGDVTSAERAVEQMRDVVRREGILSADEISGAFLVDGNRSLEAGNTARALQSFHLAKEFAPDRAGPYFAVARALWSREKDWAGAVSSLFRGTRILLRNPTSRVPAVGNLLLVLVTGSLLAAALWCLIAALRTFRLVQHDLYEGRKRSLSNEAARVASWVLWFFPVLLWMTGPWILVYWLALSFVYMKGKDRALSLAACACFLAVMPALGWVTRQSALTTDPAVRFLVDSARGTSDPERIPALEQMAASNPGEPLYRFLLAQTYHATGSSEAALQEYREIQRQDSNNAAAWINTGNLYYEGGEFAQAAEEYRRAITIDPASAIAYYNLHLALQGALRLEEADAAFQKARSLDNDLVTSILSSGDGEGRKEPREARYSGEELLDRIQKGKGGTGTAWRRDWMNPFSVAGLLGIAACLVLAWGSERWGLGRAQRCVKCGQAFCRRCQVGMRREEGYCTACRHLYVLKDPVASRVREERERLVAANQRWEWISRRLVSLVLPGAGQIQGGRTLLGVLLLWTTCLSASALLLSGRLLAFPGVMVGNPTALARVLPVAFIALSWLVANSLAFEPRRGRA